MSHETGLVDLLSPILLALITGLLFGIFVYKRRQTSIHALDWMIALFGGATLLGIMQTIKILFHDETPLLIEEGMPPGLDIVTWVHVFTLVVIYLMAEQFLNDRVNPYRFATMIALIALLTVTPIVYLTQDGIILSIGDILPFALDDVPFDNFVLDIIQLFSVCMIFYVFVLQYLISESRVIRQYLIIINLAIALFLVSAVIELLESFIPDLAINVFLTSLPTFLILAYFYIRNPNFIYLAPVNIAFMQIVGDDGRLLYAADMDEELETRDFLVGPSLTSVNYMLAELLKKDFSDFQLKEFVYSGGYIIFERVGNIRAILQTDRLSGILKRSMRYFLREYYLAFEQQVEEDIARASEETEIEKLTADEVFRRCIPIVQSKKFISSFGAPEQLEAIEQ